MKRFLVLVLVGVCCANVVFAQRAGTIAVFSDEWGTDCNFVDDGSLLQVYFFHTRHDGAIASQFRLDISLTNWVHLGDIWAFPLSAGDCVTGIGLGYDGCKSAPTYLGLGNFIGSVAATCTSIEIVGIPDWVHEEIFGYDCADDPIYPTGGRAIVNPDQSCPCNFPVPVEETTWGGIKALYVE